MAACLSLWGVMRNLQVTAVSTSSPTIASVMRIPEQDKEATGYLIFFCNMRLCNSSKHFTNVVACVWRVERLHFGLRGDDVSWSGCGTTSEHLLSLGPLMWMVGCHTCNSRNNFVWCGGCSDTSVTPWLLITDVIHGLGSRSIHSLWFASRMKEKDC